MTQTYYPFATGAGESITEAQWRDMASTWLPSGVIPGELNMLAPGGDGGGMRVLVATGAAFVDGCYYRSDAEETVPIPNAHATLPRIDLVVVRLSDTADEITLGVVQGTAAASPTPPTAATGQSTYEVPIAQVRVAAAASGIAAADVRDARTWARHPDAEEVPHPNGGFEVAQLGAGPHGAGFGLDCWQLVNITSTATVQQIASTIGTPGKSAQVDFNYDEFNGGSSDLKSFLPCGDGTEWAQYRGQQITVTALVKSTAVGRVHLWLATSGTGGVSITTPRNHLANQEERLTATITVPATATSIGVHFRFDSGDATVELNDVSLCVGPAPLVYRRRDGSRDLRLCLRQREKVTGQLVRAYAGAFLAGHRSFVERKAGAPTVTKFGTWATFNCAQPTVTQVTVDGYAVEAAVTTVPGEAYYFTDSADDYILAEYNPTF